MAGVVGRGRLSMGILAKIRSTENLVDSVQFVFHLALPNGIDSAVHIADAARDRRTRFPLFIVRSSLDFCASLLSRFGERCRQSAVEFPEDQESLHSTEEAVDWKIRKRIYRRWIVCVLLASCLRMRTGNVDHVLLVLCELYWSLGELVCLWLLVACAAVPRQRTIQRIDLTVALSALCRTNQAAQSIHANIEDQVKPLLDLVSLSARKQLPKTNKQACLMMNGID